MEAFFANMFILIKHEAILLFKSEIHSTVYNSKLNRITVRKNQAKICWYTRHIIFVFIRPTVKKFTKNCLGPFQMREKAKNFLKIGQKMPLK